MLVISKVFVLLGCFYFHAAVDSSNLLYRRTTTASICPMFRDVTIETASSRIACGIHCLRNQYCSFFLYDIQTLSCHLLAYDPAADPLNLDTYQTWDVFVVPGNCLVFGQYIIELNKCIVVHTDVEKNWNQAQDFCQSDGASLLTINSDTEFNYFRGMFDTVLQRPEFFHLGAKKTGSGATDFHWVFGSTVGAKITAWHWLENQPDNLYGDEYCIASRSEDGYYLNDVTCQYYFGYFICEYLV